MHYRFNLGEGLIHGGAYLWNFTVFNNIHLLAWIICQLVFFPFFRELSFESRQNPRVDFFTGKKRKDSKQCSPFTVAEFCAQ